ncbi:SPOR domain-containing protein [Rhodobacteraceae bacterium D3-12]|nr:SPOR domain-containing protein [Rhodobacteraceae bacterium D3-12]
MADVPFGGPTHAQDAGNGRASAVKTLGTVTNWAGAAVSLALIVGIGVWSYKTLARDVSGVPVVRAASGEPMRVAPENPGGSPALNQGLSVNKVAAEGAAEKPADRLVLAPAPVDLTADDLPSGKVKVVAQALKERPKQAEQVAPTTAHTPQMASIQALADKLSTGSAPLGEVAAAPEPSPEKVQKAAVIAPAVQAEKTALAKDQPKKVVVKGGLKRSLRPVLRPRALKATVVKASAAAPVAAAGSAVEVDPASIAAGTKLAQLGAFDSAETARGEWDKLTAKFGDYLEGKQRVVQRAKSGGRVFYRLRAMGFADMSDARRFCSALVAEKADCIPLTTK